MEQAETEPLQSATSMKEHEELVVEDFEVVVDGARLAARSVSVAECSDPQTPLVFLHEGLGSMDSWRGFPAELVKATGLRALLYDRRGYGRSEALDAPWDRDYLRRYALEELPAVLEACSVEHPLLVGHSDGGSIALIFAAHHPAEAVICLAAHVFVENAARRGIRRTVALWREGGLESRLRRIHGDKTDTVFWSWADTWLAPWFDDWNIENELAGIQCPVLLLQGDRDEYATTAHLDAIATRLPGVARSVLLQGSGHAPHLQTPQAVMDEILRFTASLDRLDAHSIPGS